MAKIRKPTLAEALLIASQPYAYADSDLVDAAVVLEAYAYAGAAREMREEAERRAMADEELQASG